jgi:CubicO group peptidase (beta-lactamase class C family)
MANIEGTCREEFQAVREVFEYHLDSGIDTGASVAVFIDGEPVVDLWGGYFDATYTDPGNATPSCRHSQPPRP